MSMQDPIAALLTSIRNGQTAVTKKKVVVVPSSTIKVAIVKVLQEEGYIDGFKVVDLDAGKKNLEVYLKYYNDKPVISRIDRKSSPGLRRYEPKNKLPKVLGGYGIAIISTSQGVMSDKQARKLGHGGEILCTVE
jgi:small subunit ribosomal protein S8